MSLFKVELTGNGMRERGDDKQQGFTCWAWSLGCCSEDRPSVHGTCALLTELLGRPKPTTLFSWPLQRCSIKHLRVPRNLSFLCCSRLVRWKGEALSNTNWLSVVQAATDYKMAVQQMVFPITLLCRRGTRIIWRFSKRHGISQATGKLSKPAQCQVKTVMGTKIAHAYILNVHGWTSGQFHRIQRPFVFWV